MKKTFILFLLLACLFNFSTAQQQQADSLDALIKTEKVGTVKAGYVYKLARLYSRYSPSKSLLLAQQVYITAQANNNYRLTNRSLNLMANIFVSLGDYTKAMQLYLKNLKLLEEHNDTVPIAIGIITHFGPDLPKVNVSQQDMRRVMLNLFNNAFYAFNQKQKSASPDYKPEVTVTTLADKKNLTIIVKDNGNGIPDAIKDKIMQAFFTTKPIGEGTGLGLSLSNDIVVKGHGGSINVNTEEGSYTEFILILPIT